MLSIDLNKSLDLFNSLTSTQSEWILKGFCIFLGITYLFRYRKRQILNPGDRVFFSFLLVVSIPQFILALYYSALTIICARLAQPIPVTREYLLFFLLEVGLISAMVGRQFKTTQVWLGSVYTQLVSKYDSKAVAVFLYVLFGYFWLALVYACFISKKNNVEINLNVLRCFLSFQMLSLFWCIKSIFLILTKKGEITYGPSNASLSPKESLVKSIAGIFIQPQFLDGTRSAWNLLNPVIGIPLLLLFVLKVLPLGFHLVPLLIPDDSFLFIFPEDGPSQFIWPFFYVFFGTIAFVPVLLILVNLFEWCIPWARRAFENIDAKHSYMWGFTGANQFLLKLVTQGTTILLPIALFGLLRFYYLDPSGIHLFHWPQKTIDYPWNSITSLRMAAWGDSEKKEGGQIRYRLLLKNGQELEACWQFFQGTTDDQVAKSYLKISRLIKNIHSIKVKTDVSQKGLEFLKQELGDDFRDVLLKP